MSLPGFEDARWTTGAADYFVSAGGSGAAMCGDYRASFHLDRAHDAEDRAAGRRIAAPTLVVTGADETQLADAGDVWRGWADDVTATSVPGGHFVPEEAPGELADELLAFLPAGERSR